jgi:hypothetical protein
MKPAETESFIGLDRLATSNEVHSAMSCSSPCDIGLAGNSDDFREMDSDFSDRTCQVREDSMWLAIASELFGLHEKLNAF